jgi:hypothetical protein
LALQGSLPDLLKPGRFSGLDLPELKPQVDDFVYIADTLQSLGINYHIDIASLEDLNTIPGLFFNCLSTTKRWVGAAAMML